MTIQTSINARYEFTVIGAGLPLIVKANTIDSAKRFALKQGFKVTAIFPK